MQQQQNPLASVTRVSDARLETMTDAERNEYFERIARRYYAMKNRCGYVSEVESSNDEEYILSTYREQIDVEDEPIEII